MKEALPPSCSVRECRHGTFACFTNDTVIGRALELYGEWAENEIAFLKALLRPGDRLVDVGANVGTHAVPLARAVGASGRAVAIEPQEEVARLLRWNLASNGLSNAEVVHAAVGRETGTVLFPKLDYSLRRNVGSVAAVEGGDGVETRRVTLDSLGLDRCDLLKLDVEGAELEALRGGLGLLEKCRPAVYMECNALEPGWRAVELLQPRGFRAFYHEATAFNPRNFKGASENIFGHARETSLLFLDDERAGRLPPERRAELKAIEGREAFVELFLSTLRYGDEPGRPTRERAAYSSWRGRLKRLLGAFRP